MRVVATRQLAARRREYSRRIDRMVREAERRRPDVAERKARIRAATRAGRAAGKSRQEAQTRLTDALRRLIGDGLSIREAAERVGVAYHEARQLIRAAEVTDREQELSTHGELAVEIGEADAALRADRPHSATAGKH